MFGKGIVMLYDAWYIIKVIKSRRRIMSGIWPESLYRVTVNNSTTIHKLAMIARIVDIRPCVVCLFLFSKTYKATYGGINKHEKVFPI